MRYLVVISIACVLTLTGCGNVTGPSAKQVTYRLTSKPEPPQRTIKWLTRWGYKPVKPTGYGGGLFPRTGPCYQRAKGTPLGGNPVVRVCFAAGKYPMVFSQHTLDHYWIEHYPNDQTNFTGPKPPGLGRISNETLETLKQ